MRCKEQSERLMPCREGGGCQRSPEDTAGAPGLLPRERRGCGCLNCWPPKHVRPSPLDITVVTPGFVAPPDSREGARAQSGICAEVMVFSRGTEGGGTGKWAQ